MKTDTTDVEDAETEAPAGQPQLPTQDVCFTNDDILQTDELPNFNPVGSSNSFVDSTCENAVCLSHYPTANNSNSPQAKFFSANFSVSSDFKPRLPIVTIMRKPIKTYRLRCAVFPLVSQLFRRIS